MKNTKASLRYAKALLELSVEQNKQILRAINLIKKKI